MKSAERYELIQKGLSEGKTQAEIARDQGVTDALISQVIKKHTPNLGVDGHPVGTVEA
jgi:hypothetical protein